MTQPVSRKLFPTVQNDNRRFSMRETRDDHLTPAARMAEHKASMEHTGPDPGSTVRMTLREKLGDEKPTVRKMYDRATKPKRRRKS